MADIFISYARQDLERVRPIVRLIEGAGWSVFWDRTIPAGNTWRQYIGKALDEAKCVIVVWSRSSVASKFVQEEADDGSEREILIPVIIEDVRPPLGFRSIQHEDLSDWKGDFDHPRARSLIKAIKGYAGNPQKGLVEPSAKPKVEVARKVEPPKSETPVPIRTEKDRRETKPDGPKPLESKSDFEKPAQKNSTTKIGLSIALFVAIVVGLVMIFRQERTKSISDISSPPVKQEQPVAIKPSAPSPQKTFTNSIGMEFVLIPPGSFTMGSQTSPEKTAEKFGDNVDWYKPEHPAHPVEISQPFYLQKTEVTQGQWRSVMGQNPSFFSECGDDCPVERVSWDEIQMFLEKLNQLQGLEGDDQYRLPTEAEWEYACRAGTITEFSFGDDAEKLGGYAWFGENSDKRTHPVGQKKPNSWGLYDMHGNISEWVEDDWHRNFKDSPGEGRAWIDEPRAAVRVIRGGSWHSDARYCRSATRRGAAVARFDDVGFRLARSFAPGS